MHPVLKIMGDVIAGLTKDAVVALIMPGGGQRWVISGGALTLLRILDFEADILGGTSGGALAMAFYADGGPAHRGMVLRCLTKQGFARDGKNVFIRRRRLLVGQPPMDLNGLLDNAFGIQYPLNLAGLAARKKPIFMTATRRNGEGVILHLNGTSAAFCRDAAHHTARLPLLAHDPTDQTVLWDGALSNDAPIEEAFRLGATHVLVINPRGANQGHSQRSGFDRWVMEPLLRQRAPDLCRLWVNRYQNAAQSWAKYANDPRVCWFQLPRVNVYNQTTDERLLVEGLKAGWDHMANMLQLPYTPAYPEGWKPTLREHGLIA